MVRLPIGIFEPDFEFKSFDICELKDGSKKAMLLLDLKPTLFNIEPIECSYRKEIVCVVDRSGSMSGTAMRNAKEALKMFIRSGIDEPTTVPAQA